MNSTPTQSEPVSNISGLEPAPKRDLIAAVSSIFAGDASAVLVESLDFRIPRPLRWDRESPKSKWHPPWQVIGIKCGGKSHGICAIILQSEDALREFLQRNPIIGQTLITSWPVENYIVWLRPTDYSPRNARYGGYEWASTGIVPVACPRLEPRYFISRDFSVAKVAFASIKWPAELHEHFAIVLLQDTFGYRYRKISSRKVILNTNFWAHFLARKLRLVYHTQKNEFYLAQSDNESRQKLTVDDLIQLIASGLQQAAMLDAPKFPVAEIRLPVIRKLVEEMKIVVAVHVAGENDGLVEFLRAKLEMKDGTDTTVTEIHNDYLEWCRKRAIPVCPETIFRRLLPQCVREMFGLAKSHDLSRATGDGARRWRRGFRGLRLKT